MWENMVEPDRPQVTIWRMHIAGCIPKSINTHSEYVIRIALQLQHWLQERASVLRCTYIGCRVIQGLPKLVIQKICCRNFWTRSKKFWSGTFQNLCLVLKFSFKPPDGLPLLQKDVTSYFNSTVVAWIGRGGKIAWPPRSLDLTPLDFSVWEYVKNNDFAPTLPASLEERRAQITEAVATRYAEKIHRIWDEIAYRWDICRLTRGKHIEHIWIAVDKT